MKVRISGRAAAFAIQRADGWQLGRRGRKELIRIAEPDVVRVLGNTPDVIEADLPTVSEAERRLETEWSKDRALRLLLLLLDSQEGVEGLAEAAKLLDRLLTNKHIVAHIENQFAQQPLPANADLARVEELAVDLTDLSALLAHIREWQPMLPQVCSSFDALPNQLFGNPDEKADYRERAVAAGAFRALANGTRDGKLTHAGLFELHGALKQFPHAREIARSWASAFDRIAVELPSLPKDMEEDFEDDVRDFGGGPGGHQQLHNALQQQRAILDRVAAGDYDNARRFARDLAQTQRASGGEVYLAKSFTRLSQRAREMEAFDLELEWAFEAVQCAPEDARTRTQYADALLQANRFEEALSEFDRAGQTGELGYAVTGYARAMRLLGKYEEALAAFSAASVDHANTEHEVYALIGMANVKGDMGDADGALAQSAEVAARFSDDPRARIHYAGLLSRRGCFEEAWAEYFEAGRLTTNKVQALNGLAQICRRTGRLSEARQRFGYIVSRYPTDVNAHIGLIDTLRNLGEIKEASMYARRTAERFPGSPRAAAKHGETKSEAGRHSLARQILIEAMGRFPRDSRLITALVDAHRREGRYDRALSIVESAIARIPHNRHLQLSRAEMLRRLGMPKAAEAAYRELLEADQGDIRARNGLACLLMLRHETGLAESLVGGDNPVTPIDWRSFLLKCNLYERRGYAEEARQRLIWGLKQCPYAAERRLFTCTLARLAAKAGQARRAPQIPLIAERDIGNVIDFQVAAMTRSVRASTAHATLQRNLPARYATLIEEIARTYGLVSSRPDHSKDWIARQIRDEMLLAAA